MRAIIHMRNGITSNRVFKLKRSSERPRGKRIIVALLRQDNCTLRGSKKKASSKLHNCIAKNLCANDNVYCPKKTQLLRLLHLLPPSGNLTFLTFPAKMRRVNKTLLLFYRLGESRGPAEYLRAGFSFFLWPPPEGTHLYMTTRRRAWQNSNKRLFFKSFLRSAVLQSGQVTLWPTLASAPIFSLPSFFAQSVHHCCFSDPEYKCPLFFWITIANKERRKVKKWASEVGEFVSYPPGPSSHRPPPDNWAAAKKIWRASLTRVRAGIVWAFGSHTECPGGGAFREIRRRGGGEKKLFLLPERLLTNEGESPAALASKSTNVYPSFFFSASVQSRESTYIERHNPYFSYTKM